MLALLVILATPPTPAPSPTPVRVNRTLQDLARDRRTRPAGGGSLTTVSSTSPHTGSPTPGPSAEASPIAAVTPTPRPPLAANLFVGKVSFGEVSAATIRVTGIVENSGPGVACQVKLIVEVQQDGGQVLGSVNAELPDRIPPRGEATFEASVKVPARTRTEIKGDGHTVFSGFADGPLATGARASIVWHSTRCPEPGP